MSISKAKGSNTPFGLPANRVLQERIGYLLTRPVGRPPNEVRRSYANFTYQAGSWTKPRRVIAKVEWHPGELYPRVGFIVTNMARPRRECRRLLQQARDLRAMDQGGQETVPYPNSKSGIRPRSKRLRSSMTFRS